MKKTVLAETELIGLSTKVLGVGIEGKIIDETQNMLIIEDKGKRKKVIKNSNVFEFTIKGQKITIKGKELIGRSEEKIKKTG